MIRRLAVAALALTSACVTAQTGTATPLASTTEPSVHIQLATIAPGELYWQRFGHNTLIVSPDDGSPISYNFGYFDFAQPDFFSRFLRGRMLYQAVALPVADDLAGYVEERRTVALQSLALNPTQAQRLATELARAVQPEHRDYLYEYFRANCSTRIRDAIDAALAGELKRQTVGRSRGATYRMHAARLAQGDPWLALGIDLGLGPDTDRALSFWEEMFIPELLRQHLREVRTVDGQPLVTQERAWFDSGRPHPPEQARDRKPVFAAIGVVLAIALLWLAARAASRNGARRALAVIAALLHLLFGLAGGVLLFLWLGTDHVAAHGNENLFLLSPLSLLLAPLWWRRARPGASGRMGNVLALLVLVSAALGLASKALPDLFIQANLQWCLLLLPVHLALYASWRRLGQPSAREAQ